MAHYSPQSQWHNKLSGKRYTTQETDLKESIKCDEEENWNSGREDESDTFT